MPLTTTELVNLKADIQVVVDGVNALVADPVPNPLQVALDAATAALAAMTAERDTAVAAKAATDAKIAAAKLKLQQAAVADAAEDAGRQGALDALA